jgi:hypothetical protein
VNEGPKTDPVEAALSEVVAGLDGPDATEVRRLVRTGLGALDTTAPPEFIAEEEIAPAAALEPVERLGWAREFALRPQVEALNGRAWNLVTALQDGEGEPDQLADEASALLSELEDIDLSGLDGDRLERVQRSRNEAIADTRWIMSGGEGPASLRAGHRQRRTAGDEH